MSINANHVLKIGQAQTIFNNFASKADARFLKSADVLTYTIKQQATAESGYAATYQLFSVSADATPVETAVGAKINIPKDMVVESGTVETVATANTPYTGAAVGDKYIDLVIANKASSHLYIPVNDLVDTYTAGDGIEISAANAVSVKIDSANANGLATTTNGLKLATVTASNNGSGGSNGAMTAAQAEKLSGIETGAQVNTVTSVAGRTGAVTVAKSDVGLGNVTNDAQVKGLASGTTSDHVVTWGADGYTVADSGYTIGASVPAGAVFTDTTYSAAVASTDGSGGSDGLMTAADKEKLNGIEYATATEVQELIDALFADDDD